jgi:hypothetical protein
MIKRHFMNVAIYICSRISSECYAVSVNTFFNVMERIVSWSEMWWGDSGTLTSGTWLCFHVFITFKRRVNDGKCRLRTKTVVHTAAPLQWHAVVLQCAVCMFCCMPAAAAADSQSVLRKISVRCSVTELVYRSCNLHLLFHFHCLSWGYPLIHSTTNFIFKTGILKAEIPLRKLILKPPVVIIRYTPPGSCNSTFCPHTVFMCFVWISEQTAIISHYSINWLVLISEMLCVYCAVRA